MSSIYETEQPRYRLAQTNYGDTLRGIAYRELGDANRWTDLVYLNRLTAPYLTNDPAEAGPKVLLSGQKIKVPSVEGFGRSGIDESLVYARDAALVGKKFALTGTGDLAVAAGVDNLSQQLKHRVVTPRGQLVHHPRYGSYVWRLVGRTSEPIIALLGSEYVKSAIKSDYRVSRVIKAEATISGESVSITATAIAIDGSNVAIEI